MSEGSKPSEHNVIENENTPICFTVPFPLHKKTMKMASQNKLTGGRLNKKDGLSRYGDSHVKDKTS